MKKDLSFVSRSEPCYSFQNSYPESFNSAKKHGETGHFSLSVSDTITANEDRVSNTPGRGGFFDKKFSE